MVQSTWNFELFDQKKSVYLLFLNHFWQSIDTILEDVSVAETINAQLLTWRLPPFSVPKITVIRHV